MAEPTPTLADLNDRSRAIFGRLVETYLASGDPVGSRTLSKSLELGLSAASVRNVMQDLEQLGLLDSPHTSAGRIPTQMGLRLFVDGVLEMGDVSTEERAQIERSMAAHETDLAGMLDEAGSMLSGLSHCAALVFAPTSESPIRHLDFIRLSENQGLAVVVMEDGTVENRLFDIPAGLTQSAMQAAANFLNAHLRGVTLPDARLRIQREISDRRAELDTLAASLVERGIGLWDDGGGAAHERLMVRGRANLLGETQTDEDLERMRRLFDDLEQKRDLAQLLEMVQEGEGVRVFIGSENKLFSMSGSALVIAPYTDGSRRMIGAIGVIGPTRLNYGRIVPIVDYTARMVGRMVSDGAGPGTQRKGT
ncbi:MAG: heat-inducible transcriptional repressor HrcA [Pseudomonadota bacterium]